MGELTSSVISSEEVRAINWGIRTVLDAVEASAYVAEVFGSIALLVAAFAFLVSKNQLNFGVITSCNDRFQRIVPWMESRDRRERRQGERQYVDLCNEQLFYFRNNYLPREVVEEWLDGMIEYLPQLDQDRKPYEDPNRTRMIDPVWLEDYPRIVQAFSVDHFYDLENPEQRLLLIRRIRKNLRKARFGYQ